MREPAENRALRHSRRAALQFVMGFGLAMPALRRKAAAAGDPKSSRPQPGDRLVYLSGARKGAVIEAAALPIGGPPVLAYPFDPATETVRNGSRLNQVVVVRLDPAQLDETTRPQAAEGVVAYSAVCTHQGCPVSMWKAEAGALFCSCHGSQFDPRRAAEVIAGPAPRRLAMLPLATADDGALMAARPFTGRVGFK